MRKFQEKRRFKRILYSKGTIIVLAVILFFLGRAVISAHYKYSLTKKSEGAAVARYEELKIRKETLEGNLNKLETARGIEEELRERFNVARPGEEVIIITE